MTNVSIVMCHFIIVFVTQDATPIGWHRNVL